MDLTAAQILGIDKSLRQFQIETGQLFSEFLQEQVLDIIANSPIGYMTAAKDLDSIAAGGGAFSIDAGSTAGLTLGFSAGKVLVEGTGLVSTGAGTVALSASNTNYVEWDPADSTVKKNTVGFTEGRVPLYEVVTGVATITTITQRKPLLRARPNGGLTGALLSTPSKTFTIQKELGSISATTAGATILRIGMPNFVSRLARVVFYPGATIAASDADFWTPSIVNKQAGAGAVAMLATTAADTNKVTGGAAYTADTARVLTLHGTSGNLDTAPDDEIQILWTKTGAPGNITGNLKLEFTHSN
jgi:hypothetical protein